MNIIILSESIVLNGRDSSKKAMDTSNVSEDIASLYLANHVSRECAHIRSFGEVLNSIREVRQITQEELAVIIVRSPAEVSRLINNIIPKYMTFTDVEKMALDLACSPPEIVQLVNAFTCHVMGRHGLIDPNVF